MVYARAQARAQVRRTIEATGIRSLVRKEMEGTTTPTIVLSDYNAGNPSVVAQIVSGPSAFRFDPIEKKRKLWDRMLYDAVDLQSMQSLNSTYYTHIYDGDPAVATAPRRADPAQQLPLRHPCREDR